MTTYAYTDYKGLSVIDPTPSGVPAQNIDANFKIVADALANSPTNIAHVSANGDDATGDGSFYKPFGTLQKAFDRVAAGTFTAIKLGPGTFEAATFTATSTTPSDWSLLGSGMWSSAVESLRIVATTSHGGMNIHLADFKSSGESANPAIAVETSVAIGRLNLDVRDVYLSRGGGDATETIRIEGTSPSSNPFAMRMAGLSHVRATGSGQNCVYLGHGQFQMIGGGMWSTSGNEIKALSGATAVQLSSVLLGSMAGIGKSAALIGVENSGTGLRVLLSPLVATMGTGHLIDAAAGAQMLAMVDGIVAIRGGAGGVSVPAGVVIVGDTVDASTGAELPITAHQKINFKKALSTAFSPATSTHWTTSPTTVQAALDEIAARQGGTTNLLTNGDCSNGLTGWTTGNQQEPNQDGSGGTAASSTFSVASSTLTISRTTTPKTEDWVTGYVYQAVSVDAGQKVRLSGSWAGAPASGGNSDTYWWAEAMLVSLPSGLDLSAAPSTYGFSGLFATPNTPPTWGKYAGTEKTIIRAIVSYPGNVANFGGNGGILVHASNYYNNFGANGINSPAPTWTTEDFAKRGTYQWARMQRELTAADQDPVWRQTWDIPDCSVISQGTVLVILKYGSKYSNDGTVSFSNLNLVVVPTTI